MRFNPARCAVCSAPIGADKTTTINLFLNFIEPTSGTATINGIDVTQKPLGIKKYIVYIHETS